MAEQKVDIFCRYCNHSGCVYAVKVSPSAWEFNCRRCKGRFTVAMEVRDE